MLNYCFIIIKRTGYLHKKHYANKWKELVHDDQNDFLKIKMLKKQTHFL